MDDTLTPSIDGRDIRRTLIVSIGCDAAEQTNLSGGSDEVSHKSA